MAGHLEEGKGQKMKRIVLIRHAKSSWADSSLADIDRPLNGRGKRDAPFMGKRLQQHGVKPDVVLCSPAKRARKTAKIIAKAVGFPKSSLRYDQQIYYAGPRVLLHLLKDLDDVADVVFLVGHNYAITDFCCQLSGESIDNIPTCGIAAIDFPLTEWQGLTTGGGKLAFFDYPKKHRPQK